MDTGQKIWQILPLGPTGYGDSPYQCFSAFGGNPLLLSLDQLVDHEYLTAKDVVGRQRFPLGRVDYRAVIQWKFPVLAKAAKALLRRASERYEFDCDRKCPLAWTAATSHARQLLSRTSSPRPTASKTRTPSIRACSGSHRRQALVCGGESPPFGL